jgi:excisionase family DNA binding protein
MKREGMKPGPRSALQAESGHVMTVDQVAEYLQLNRLTVYRYVREGRIPSAKIGKLYRILKADVDGFLERQKTASGAAAGRQAGEPAAAGQHGRASRTLPNPIQRSPEEIYVGPSWRERRREEEATRKPAYPIEWVIRSLH